MGDLLTALEPAAAVGVAALMNQQPQHPLAVAPEAVPAVVPANALAGGMPTPGALIQMSLDRGQFDPVWLERMMALDREFRADLARQAFNKAFARFKAKNIVVPKTKFVQMRKKDGTNGPSYHQSEMSRVAELLQPALAEEGLSYRFNVRFERMPQGGIKTCYVTCIFQHELGHSEQLTLEGPPDDSGAKNPLQEMQSSSTFLQRHAVLAITGTAQAGVDNDGRGARGYREDEDRDYTNDGSRGGTQPPSASVEERQGLVDQGQEAATKGTAAFLAWWKSLEEAQRKPIMGEFRAMRDAAAQFDKEGVR